MNAISQPQPVYPFRHVERKTWLFVLVGLIAAAFSVTLAVTTLGGVQLAALAAMASVAVGLIIYRLLLSRFSDVLPCIIGGRRRIAILAAEITLGLVGITAFSALHVNRAFATMPPTTVSAIAERVSQVRGPKLWGWDATFRIGGETYYQMVSPEVARVASQNSKIVLTVQPGALGYGFITAASAE